MNLSHALPLWRRLLIALMRGFYFRRVRLAGTMPPDEGPRLLLFSHRNGAIDGYVALVACPRAQFVLSAQLLRNPLLRLMFAGIPVVRGKDRQRYGMSRGDFADPIESSCAHVRSGGALAFFPEGSSEWRPSPQPYQAGFARIVRRLLEEGVNPQVVPVGLFYRQPDGFRSDVDIFPGPPVDLPPRMSGEHPRQWEKRLRAVMGAALDAVSVNCPDEAAFLRVERQAARQADSGRSSYGEAFLHWQAAARRGELPEEDVSDVTHRARRRRIVLWHVPFIAVFCLLLAPVLLAGRYMGGKADARNTVSFFRMIGGLAMALIWLPAVLVLFFIFPWAMGVLSAMAWFGWLKFPASAPSF